MFVSAIVFTFFVRQRLYRVAMGCQGAEMAKLKGSNHCPREASHPRTHALCDGRTLQILFRRPRLQGSPPLSCRRTEPHLVRRSST